MKSLRLPIFASPTVAPSAGAASSITTRRCSAASSAIVGISAASPIESTGMIALVRGVIAASISDVSMFNVQGSTSTKTGVAPAWRMELAVAMKLRDGQMTSSPLPIPAAISARVNAAVQFEVATACLAPT